MVSASLTLSLKQLSLLKALHGAKIAQFVYSADGGKTWGNSGELKKKNKEGKMVVVNSTEFTHIRWKHKGPLKAGETRKTGFQVTLVKQ